MAELSIALFEDVLGRIAEQDTRARTAQAAPAVDVLHGSVQRLVEDVDALRHVYLMDLPETSAAHLRLVDDVTHQLRATRGVAEAPAAHIDVEVAATFLAGGILSLLRAWVTGQVDAAPTQITEQIMRVLPPWLSADEPAATEPQGPVP